MKKIIALLIIFVIALTVKVSDSKAEDVYSDLEKLAEKQNQLIIKLEKEMEKEGFTYQNIDEVGNFYFKGESIVFQVDEDNKDQNKVKKFKKIIERFRGGLSVTNAVDNSVKYSYTELANIQDQISERLGSIKPKVSFKLSMNTPENRLDLTIQSIPVETHQFLEKEYSDLLKIKIDPNYNVDFNELNEATKSRKSDFNNLGAGIGIKLRALDEYGVEGMRECSTAGVAHDNKGNYWLMTAGHCNDRNLTPFYQWDAFLGSTYLDFTGSGYDFLLIDVKNSNITRRATNGLYSQTATTESGYDSSLTGELRPRLDLPVCKVGISTNRTCGHIINERDSIDGKITFTVRNKNGEITSSKGDSGGAWYTQSLPQRLVGIHWGGTDKTKVNGEWMSRTSYVTPWIEVAQKAGIYLYTSNSVVPIK